MKKAVDDLYVKDLCTGCNACVSICPAHVLESEYDKEGFIRPVIKNYDDCISCGLCLKVCNIHNKPQSPTTGQTAFIAQSKHTRKVKKSASGGAFYELARTILQDYNGVVFGAAFDDNLKVRHVAVDQLEHLPILQGSKYVQSDTNGIYGQLKKYLESNRYVLFSGTPCQIHGLLKFLRKDYPRLYTVDIVCHGVASPWLLRHHIEAIESTHYSKVRKIRFRWKNPLFKSGSSFYMMMMMMKNGYKFLRIGKNDAYMNLYLNGVAFRECCYNCKFANLNRPGDFTIGDCDSHRFYPNFHPDESNSIIVLNTAKARLLWAERIQNNFDFEKLDLKREASCNKQLNAPFPRPETRDNIYSKLADMPVEEYFRTYSNSQTKIHEWMTKVIIYLPAPLMRLINKLRK